jgi:hypothetical protein
MNLFSVGWKTKFLAKIAIGILTLTALLLLVTPPAILDVRVEGKGARTIYLRKGARVSLRWNHSLEKVLITEVYAVEPEKLVLVKTVIERFVPVPYNEEDFSYSHGAWVARWPALPREELLVRVGTVANQRLIVREEAIALKDLGDAKSLVRIRVLTVHRWIFERFSDLLSSLSLF